MLDFLRTRPGTVMLQLAALIAILAAWQLVAAVQVFPPTLVPEPLAVAVDFIRLLGTSTFWSSVGMTLLGAAQGLLAAIVVGVPVGLITGRLRIVEESTRFLFEVGRAFPAIALLPVFLLILGANTNMKAIVVFLAVVFPILIQSQQGAMRIEPSIEETVAAYRIPRRQHILKVTLPTAASYIATGIQLAATVSVLVAIGVEVLGGVPGVGRELTLAQQASNPATAFAYILTAALLGFGVNALVGFLKRRIIRWNANDHAE